MSRVLFWFVLISLCAVCVLQLHYRFVYQLPKSEHGKKREAVCKCMWIVFWYFIMDDKLKPIQRIESIFKKTTPERGMAIGHRAFIQALLLLFATHKSCAIFPLRSKFFVNKQLDENWLDLVVVWHECASSQCMRLRVCVYASSHNFDDIYALCESMPFFLRHSCL